MRRALAAASSVVLVACASAAPITAPRPPPPEAPLPELSASSSASSAPLAPPPDAEPTALPTLLARHRASSGLSAVVVHRAGDVDHVRVVVRGAGLAADPSVASGLARELSTRLARDPLPGSSAADVEARADALVVSFASTDVRAALTLLGPALRSLGKVVAPTQPDARSLADVALYRALYKLPTSTHPYADLGPTGAVSLRDLTRFAEARVVADAITVVVVGGAAARDVVEALDPPFAKTKPAPAIARPTPPISPESPRLFVIDVPRTTAHVVIGLLSLDRSDDAWPELELVVRAREDALAPKLSGLSLALVPMRDGACPIIARFGAAAGDVADQVKQALTSLPPEQTLAASPAAIDRAARLLAREHAMVVGQPARLADHLAALAALGREEAPAVATMPQKPRLAISFAEQPPSSPVVIVEGDASKIADSLATIAEVTVLDPKRGLAPSRVVKARAAP